MKTTQIRESIYDFIKIYVDTPEPKKLCSSIEDLVEELAESKVKNLALPDVSESALTTSDLIAFTKWVDDKMYNQRLQVMPRDLTKFYKENRISIMKQYL